MNFRRFCAVIHAISLFCAIVALLDALYLLNYPDPRVTIGDVQMVCLAISGFLGFPSSLLGFCVSTAFYDIVRPNDGIYMGLIFGWLGCVLGNFFQWIILPQLFQKLSSRIGSIR